jgi:hypothetical protein
MAALTMAFVSGMCVGVWIAENRPEIGARR